MNRKIFHVNGTPTIIILQGDFQKDSDIWLAN